MAVNEEFTGFKCDTARKGAVEGCHSSFKYYENIPEQIASIVTSLIKGHFFMDGNKRTALFTYILLSKLNDFDYIEDDDELIRIFVELASTRKSIGEYAKMLFPEL